MKTTQFFSLFLAAAAAFLLASCASTKHPIGFPLEQDLSEEITGAWSNPEGVMHVHCDAKGNLKIAGLEWDEDKGEFAKSGASGPLRSLPDDFLVLNIREDGEGDDEDADENYTFALMKVDGDKIVVWGPSTSGFRELVEKKKTEGILTDHGVILTSEGEALAKTIVDESMPNLFEWGEPMIFWRMPDR